MGKIKEISEFCTQHPIIAISVVSGAVSTACAAVNAFARIRVAGIQAKGGYQLTQGDLNAMRLGYDVWGQVLRANDSLSKCAETYDLEDGKSMKVTVKPIIAANEI